MFFSKKIVTSLLILFCALTFLLTGCLQSKPQEKLVILSSSENKALEPLLAEFGRQNHLDIQMQYKGSVDIMLELEKNNPPYDAVWAANSMWISLGDKQHLVKHSKSMMTSPIVFGIKKSLAQQLGFVDKPVTIKDILAAIQAKKLTFAMTSASQSNSGASAYLGFLSALLNNPDTISKKDLHQPQLKKDIASLLGGINRSSASSEWLKDLFLQTNYDAMVNYEAVIMETNRELIKQGREPLYLVYPVDGLVMADYTLGYLNQGDQRKEEAFQKLQAYLLSKDVQQKILALGRRTGFGGTISNSDPAIFNPAWGVDTKKILSPIKLPAAEVILEALNLYQTEFRKPSLTVFCLDFSGSMAGVGEKQLKQAMTILLKQEIAKKYLLQVSQQDLLIIIPFNHQVIDIWQTQGNDPASFEKIYRQVENLKPEGGTDIYSPAVTALEVLGKINLKGYLPAIVLMTDGKSNTGKQFSDLQQMWQTVRQDIPIFPIMFGEASEEQLQQISQLSKSTILDGRKDLITAFKKVRGYSQ